MSWRISIFRKIVCWGSTNKILAQASKRYARTPDTHLARPHTGSKCACGANTYLTGTDLIFKISCYHLIGASKNKISAIPKTSRPIPRYNLGSHRQGRHDEMKLGRVWGIYLIEQLTDSAHVHTLILLMSIYLIEQLTDSWEKKSLIFLNFHISISSRILGVRQCSWTLRLCTPRDLLIAGVFCPKF